MSTARDPETSYRSDWVRTLRRISLEAPTPEAREVCTALLWLSTYANPDGSKILTGIETVRQLAGCSYDRASTLLAVGRELGLLHRRRRPNQTSVHHLTVPPGPIFWESSPAYGKLVNSRHKQRHAKDRAARRAAIDPQGAPEQQEAGTRTMSAPGVPDHERAGGSGTASQDPDHERAHPRTMSAPRVPDHERAGGEPLPVTYPQDLQMADVVRQQAVRAREDAAADEIGEDPEVAALVLTMRAHCSTCIDCASGFAGCVHGRNIQRQLERMEEIAARRIMWSAQPVHQATAGRTWAAR